MTRHGLRSLVGGFLLISVGLGTTSTQASMLFLRADLDGPSESPPNASPGTGSAFVTIDTVAQTMRLQVSFQDLVAPVIAAHIHAATDLPLTGTAGVATQTPTFQGFPAGVTAGTYDQTFDLTATTTYRPAFLAANGGLTSTASAVLIAALVDQKAYFNIHTTMFPGGEIRGFFSPVPEPSSLGLLAVGLCGGVLGLGRRRRRVIVA